MKCKWKDCNNDVQGKAQYCSGACRVKQSRSTPQVLQGVGYVTVDGKCYNRPSVVCVEFGTRPEPLDSTDCVVVKNRGRYRRVDGSVYQFDCTGRVREKSPRIPEGPPASLADYNDPNGREYVPRACAELLNWGVPMSAHELEFSSFSTNRVVLPGDWDYVG